MRASTTMNAVLGLRLLACGLIACVCATPLTSIAQSVSPPPPSAASASVRRALDAPGPTGVASGDAVDPWEGFNRRVYGFNRVLDRDAFRPVALGYVAVTPGPVRLGLRHVISNLGEPLVFVNDLLQLKFGLAGRTATRFAVNSTFGIVGLFDVGSGGGLPHHANDFGLTLARAGVHPGAYVFLPILGPSSVRDLVGAGFDVALNPLTWTRYPHDRAIGVGLGVVGGLGARADADTDLKAIDAMSTDGYATLRSFYQQNRQAQVTGGVVDVNALPDFDSPDTPPSAPPGATPPGV